MCIRDRRQDVHRRRRAEQDRPDGDSLAARHLEHVEQDVRSCLLYTSDAADDLLCVDLGGRRIIKKKRTRP